MKRKTKRLWLVLLCGICVGMAAILTLKAFSSDIVFFMTPSQVAHTPPSSQRTIKLGGMVVANSLHIHHEGNTPVATFGLTDGQAAIEVHYTGILPDLFREGQSAVAIGSMTQKGFFEASEVLAKHDETYMPKDVADALQKSGKWDPRFGPPPDPKSWSRMIKSAPSHSSARATP